jgi:hypothetical protein
LDEKEKAQPNRDRPDFEGKMEHQSTYQLPGVPPMSGVIRYIVTSLNWIDDLTVQRFNDSTRRSQ